MKPLSDMTTEELYQSMDRDIVAAITDQTIPVRVPLYSVRAAVRELLRRKETEVKELCAATIDAFDNPSTNASSPKPSFSLRDLANVIREMQ